MSNLGYPKRESRQSTGQKGEKYIEFFIENNFDWSYRPVHQETDFGIDGYIDIVTDSKVTGLSIGVQIKCGNSYISKKTKGGIKYEGNNKHLNFYLNHKIPIILIVVDADCENSFWIEFDIEKTMPTSSGWWIEIPEQNKITKDIKQIWEKIAGIPEDFSDEVQKQWAVSKLIQNSDLLIFSIPKEDVDNCSMKTILSTIKKLSKNKEMLLQKKSSVEIFFPDYDNDKRELYMIEEIRKWFVKSLKEGIPWFYFLHTEGASVGIKLLFSCVVNVIIHSVENKTQKLESDFDEHKKWLDINFHNLNVFTENNNIDEVNEEVSLAVINVYKKMFGIT